MTHGAQNTWPQLVEQGKSIRSRHIAQLSSEFLSASSALAGRVAATGTLLCAGVMARFMPTTNVTLRARAMNPNTSKTASSIPVMSGISSLSFNKWMPQNCSVWYLRRHCEFHYNGFESKTRSTKITKRQTNEQPTAKQQCQPRHAVLL